MKTAIWIQKTHLFRRDERAFYGLDRLWNDGGNSLELPFDQTVAD